MLLALHVENPITSVTTSAEPQKSKKSKKSKLIEISLVIPGIRPAYQNVSKLANSKENKYVVLAKCILKPATILKPKAELMNKTKPLDLAFMGAAPFQYLAKQKDVEIFTVSMQDIENELNTISMKDIEYQLNKIAKTPTNLKTVVPEKYHKFFDVFSKKASDTFLPHSKYDHQICLLENYRDYGNSPLSKMFEPKL